jgi:hypothetical protein
VRFGGSSPPATLPPPIEKRGRIHKKMLESVRPCEPKSNILRQYSRYSGIEGMANDLYLA